MQKLFKINSKITPGAGSGILRLHITWGFIILTIIAFPPLSAEIIYLRNGRTETGSIEGQSPDYITMVDKGVSKRVKKTDILRIRFQSSATEEDQIRNFNDIEAMLDWQDELDRILKKRREESQLKETERIKRLEEEQSFFRDEIFEIKKRKKESAFYRSLFFPGWGQFYKGQDKRAFTIMGSALFAAGYSHYSFNEYEKNSSDYNLKNIAYASLFYWQHNAAISYYSYTGSTKMRNEMNTNMQRGNFLIGTFLTVYLINIADAYWSDMSLGGDDDLAFTGSRGQFDVSMQPEPTSGRESTAEKGSPGGYSYALRYSLFF